MERQRILHLYIDVEKDVAFQVKQLIEEQFGNVQSCYLLDGWFETGNARTIYYQRLLNQSFEGFEEFEDNGNISDEKLRQGIYVLRHDPRCQYVRYRINDSDWYEA